MMLKLRGGGGKEIVFLEKIPVFYYLVCLFVLIPTYLNH